MGPAARVGISASQKGFEREGNTVTANATAPSQTDREWASRFTIVHTGVIRRVKNSVDSGANTAMSAKACVWEDAAGPTPGALRAPNSAAWPMVSSSSVDATDVTVSVVSGETVWVGWTQGPSGYTPSLNIVSGSPLTTSDINANGTGSFAAPTTFGTANLSTAQKLDLQFWIQTSKL
jgi:hypothetical protein